MHKINYRLDDYLFNEIKNMANYFNVTINSMINELVEIGILEKEKQILNGGKNDEK